MLDAGDAATPNTGTVSFQYVKTFSIVKISDNPFLYCIEKNKAFFPGGEKLHNYVSKVDGTTT